MVRFSLLEKPKQATSSKITQGFSDVEHLQNMWYPSNWVTIQTSAKTAFSGRPDAKTLLFKPGGKYSVLLNIEVKESIAKTA